MDDYGNSGKFTEFQHAIFTIVDELAMKPENSEHLFTKQWTKLRQLKNPISATTSWCSVKNFGFEDIFAYKDFLQKCPNIAKYVQFAQSKTTRQGFDYGIIDQPDAGNFLDSSTIQSSLHSIESPSTTGTESYLV